MDSKRITLNKRLAKATKQMVLRMTARSHAVRGHEEATGEKARVRWKEYRRGVSVCVCVCVCVSVSQSVSQSVGEETR